MMKIQQMIIEQSNIILILLLKQMKSIIESEKILSSN
jgi:hypothetical protein